MQKRTIDLLLRQRDGLSRDATLSSEILGFDGCDGGLTWRGFSGARVLLGLRYIV